MNRQFSEFSAFFQEYSIYDFLICQYDVSENLGSSSNTYILQVRIQDRSVYIEKFCNIDKGMSFAKFKPIAMLVHYTDLNNL